MKKVLVTGGTGFIGSHIIDALLTQEANVRVFDNLTAGTTQNIKQWRTNPNLNFIKGDLANSADLAKIEKTRFETVFHLAANPEVRVGSTNPDIHFQQNMVATHKLLESIRKTKNNLLQHTKTKPTLVFTSTSTSTTYGEPTSHPHTPPKKLRAFKPYLHIRRIQTILLTHQKTTNQVEIYNIGFQDQINVKTIAQTAKHLTKTSLASLR